MYLLLFVSRCHPERSEGPLYLLLRLHLLLLWLSLLPLLSPLLVSRRHPAKRRDYAFAVGFARAVLPYLSDTATAAVALGQLRAESHNSLGQMQSRDRRQKARHITAWDEAPGTLPPSVEG